jgi:hypothetical protein
VPGVTCAKAFGGDAATRGGDAGASCVAKGATAPTTVSPSKRGLEWIDSSLAIFSALDDAALSGAGEPVSCGNDVDACDVAKPAIADEDTWETASSVEPGLDATRSRAPEGDTSGGVGNDVAASKGMLATISALVGAASSDLGDGVTVGRGLGTSEVAKAAKTDTGASETASPLEPGFELRVSMAIEGDAAASGVGEGVTAGRDVDACGVVKPATTGAGASETASLFEPDFGSINLAASEGDTA